jgi:hypothetical protein
MGNIPRSWYRHRKASRIGAIQSSQSECKCHEERVDKDLLNSVLCFINFFDPRNVCAFCRNLDYKTSKSVVKLDSPPAWSHGSHFVAVGTHAAMGYKLLVSANQGIAYSDMLASSSLSTASPARSRNRAARSIPSPQAGGSSSFHSDNSWVRSMGIIGHGSSEEGCMCDRASSQGAVKYDQLGQAFA